MKATLAPLGEPTSLRRLMRARALPLWEMRDATLGEDGPQPQPVPEYEFDVRQEVACKSCCYY